MDDLPTLYKRIIDDPAALHDAFKNAQGTENFFFFSFSLLLV